MANSIRDIRLFVAAYEERSFTAAAARERATQSGVSQHIRKLEDLFQVRLFERGGGRIAPTPAGNAYYMHCLEVLRSHEAAQAAVLRFAGGLAGEIRVGLMPTMTRSVLAPALARFAESNPNVAISVTEAYSGVLTSQVRAGAHDFAIVPAVPGVQGVRMRHFLRTPEVLVSSAGSGLKHMQSVRLCDLGAIKVVLPSPSNTRRQTLEGYFTSGGVTVERVMELDAMMGTLDLVSRTDWLTVLPGVMMTNDVASRSFTISPIVDPPLMLDLVMIEPARRTLSEPASSFFEALAATAAEVNACWSSAAPAAAPRPRADRNRDDARRSRAAEADAPVEPGRRVKAPTGGRRRH